MLSPTGSPAVNVRWRLLVPAATAVATTAMLGTAFVAVRPGVTQMMLILLGGATATTAIGPAVAVVLDVVPLGVRATAVLIFALVQNLMGLAVGPVLTGALADKWGLTTALGFVAVFGLAAGLFSIGYFLFEIPSNLFMARYGGRRAFCVLMVLWSFASASSR